MIVVATALLASVATARTSGRVSTTNSDSPTDEMTASGADRVAKNNAASIWVLAECGFTVVGEATAVTSMAGVPVDERVLKFGADERGRAP
jgi:hypothetical protein